MLMLFSAGFDCLKMSLGTFDISLDHLCGILSAAGPCTANVQLNPSLVLGGGGRVGEPVNSCL